MRVRLIYRVYYLRQKKEIVFSLCWFFRLSVYLWTRLLKKFRPIFIKFKEYMEYGPCTKRLDFGNDPDPNMDPGSFFHFSNMEK